MKARELIDHFGGVTATATALGIKPPSVSEWLKNDEVPIGRQCQAEVVTAGKLKADRALVAIPPANQPHGEAA